MSLNIEIPPPIPPKLLEHDKWAPSNQSGRINSEPAEIVHAIFAVIIAGADLEPMKTSLHARMHAGCVIELSPTIVTLAADTLYSYIALYS